MNTRYIRGCVGRIFLFGLGHSVDILLAHDAHQQQYRPSETLHMNTSLFAGRTSVYYDSDHRQAGTCRALKRQALLPQHNRAQRAVHAARATPRRRPTNYGNGHYHVDDPRPPPLVDDTVLVCSCRGSRCNGASLADNLLVGDARRTLVPPTHLLYISVLLLCSTWLHQ